MKGRKLLAFGLATVMAATIVLTGCGSTKTENSDADSEHFTILTVGSVDSMYYDDYGNNPVIQWWLAQDWDADADGSGTQITVDFTMPVEGSESDYVNTLIATGEYPDYLPLAYASSNVKDLYDQGIALDLTDYIAEYMPNLSAWLVANPTFAAQLQTEVDGEMRYLTLPDVSDQAGDPWDAINYRRDWIVKYGTNPTTGEAFTGGWSTDADGNRVWTDDVVFPSGETDPYYISDWEWMLDIFDKAIKDQGISGGYAFQNNSTGYWGCGDLNSGFGKGIGYYGYYLDKDGTVINGLTTKNARAYLECMANWYENGWMNKDFEEQTDVWFQVDQESIYAGKVGVWIGLVSQWGNNLDTGDAYTDGICVYAAPQPINDVYGDDDCKGNEPTLFYEATMAGTGAIITSNAADKDLGTFLTALDYFYSLEGGCNRMLGLSDEQVEEIRTWDNGDEVLALYDKLGLDYAYYDEDRDGTTYHVRNSAILNLDDGAAVAIENARMYGLTVNGNLDKGLSDFEQHCYDMANMYTATGALGLLTSKLSVEESDQKNVIDANTNPYVSQAYGDFITGDTDITSDADWQAFCDTIDSYGMNDMIDTMNAAFGK